MIFPNCSKISFTCSSLTLRVKLLTTIEYKCSGLADRERLLRIGDLPRDTERRLDKEREGDLEEGLINKR